MAVKTPYGACLVRREEAELGYFFECAGMGDSGQGSAVWLLGGVETTHGSHGRGCALESRCVNGLVAANEWSAVRKIQKKCLVMYFSDIRPTYPDLLSTHLHAGNCVSHDDDRHIRHRACRC